MVLRVFNNSTWRLFGCSGLRSLSTRQQDRNLVPCSLGIRLCLQRCCTFSNVLRICSPNQIRQNNRNTYWSFDCQQNRSIYCTPVLNNDLVDVHGPAFAESITEGDIRWLKQKGDFVNADQVVAEIETDKTAVEVTVPESGVIEELLVVDGDKVTAKQLLLRLRPSEGVKADTKKPDALKLEPAKQQQTIPQKLDSIPVKAPAMPVTKVSSVAEHHDVKSSVLKFSDQARPPSQATPEAVSSETITGNRTEYRVKMNRMRSKIAHRLKNAQNTYAMLTTFNEVDMSTIVKLRKVHNESFQKKHGVKLGFMSPFVKATAYALQDQPIVNAVIDEGDIVYRQFVDVSVAVASPRGLVVPVIRNVETMSLADIERAIAHYAELAQTGKLAVEDMEGGTFTISNGGVFGSLFGTPIINPPQSAILGIHAIVDRPAAVDGKVEIRPMMYICLTYDHRLIDGREAVTFLRNIKRVIEDPSRILLGL